jgi:hypothetical protein
MAGWTLSIFAAEHATATNVIARALALNPNSSHGWLASGFVSLAQTGRSERSKRSGVRSD